MAFSTISSMLSLIFLLPKNIRNAKALSAFFIGSLNEEK